MMSISGNILGEKVRGGQPVRDWLCVEGNAAEQPLHHQHHAVAKCHSVNDVALKATLLAGVL